MTYEEIINLAEAKCDEWFVQNPDYFYDKARQIAEQRKAWERELERLNPTIPKSVWLNDTNLKEKVEVIIPIPKNQNQKRIEPSIIDPIFACVGKYPPLERKTVVNIPQDKEDALLVYAACLLILHDGAAINGAGYQVITKDIWPDTWPQQWARWAVKFFDPKGNDRSKFVEAALRYVEAEYCERAMTRPTNKHLYQHLADYREVTWNDTPYEFNKNQAKAVKLLWQAWKDPNKAGVDQKDIAAVVDSVAKQFRLQDLFRMHTKGGHEYHPAWGTMIRPVGAGVYKLDPNG